MWTKFRGCSGDPLSWIRKYSANHLARGLKTEIQFENQKELELVCGLRKFLDEIWKNGVGIASVRASELNPLDITPRSIMGIDAFNYLMPFIPIEVPNYNKDELRNQISFFRDEKWLQTENVETQEQIEQLSFLSNRNPARLYDICCLL